jgi:signal peptidase I
VAHNGHADTLVRVDVIQETPYAYPDADDEDDVGRSHTRDAAILIAVALVLALAMKAFLIQAFFIPSGSMETTLHGCPGCRGDRVLVNKVVYKFRDIHRGEIVVFNGKGTTFTSENPVSPAKNKVQAVMRHVQSWIGFGSPGDKDFIKRVIGIPGDVVACCSNNHVTVNGHEMDEPYVCLSEGQPQLKFEPVTVPPGQLFLMGDHRDGSQDSRFNGPVPESKVVGRAFAVFFPPTRAKVLRVPDAFDPKKAGDGPKPPQPRCDLKEQYGAPAVAPLTAPGAPPAGASLALVVPVVTPFAVRRRRRRPVRSAQDGLVTT